MLAEHFLQTFAGFGSSVGQARNGRFDTRIPGGRKGQFQGNLNFPGCLLARIAHRGDRRPFRYLRHKTFVARRMGIPDADFVIVWILHDRYRFFKISLTCRT